MRAPLHFPHRPFVPDKLRLAHAAHARCARRISTELDHAAVPDAQDLVYAAAREHERPVLVPVKREDFAARRRDGQCGRGERCGESVCARAGGRVCGGAEVKDLERAVGRASGDDVGLVWREEGLVDT